MNSWEKERAEQKAADQAEERRVARQDQAWQEDQEQRLWGDRSPLPPIPPMPPWLFADERSQRRAEREARQDRSLDDYAAWQGMAPSPEQLFR